MTEETNLEELLKVITEEVEDSEQKSIVELYLKRPGLLSAEAKQEAVGILKGFLSKYPELNSIQQARKSHPGLISCRQDISALKKVYESWCQEINKDIEPYKQCCKRTMRAYVTALKQEIKDMGARISQLQELEDKYVAGEIENVDMDKWNSFLEEKENTLENFQTNYNKNRFFLQEESIWAFFVMHAQSDHWMPYEEK